MNSPKCTLIGWRSPLTCILLLSLMFSLRAHAQFTTKINNGQITIVKYTVPAAMWRFTDWECSGYA